MNALSSLAETETVLVAPLIDSVVQKLHHLHERVRQDSGKNLKPKTLDDIHQMVAREQLLMTENDLGPTGMISVRKIQSHESHHILSCFKSAASGPRFDAGRIAEINTFAVHPAHQRDGLGNLLLKQALSHGKKLGITHAFARIAQGNTTARDLFEKHQFRYAQDDLRTGDGTPLWVFTRAL